MEYLIRLRDQDGSEGLTFLIDAPDLPAAEALAWTQQQLVFGGPMDMPEWAKPESLSTEITANMIETCIATLRGSRFIVGEEQVRAMIAAESSLRRALLTYYIGEAEADMDTADRDYLKDAFARTVLGVDGWPSNGDSDAVHAQFITAAQSAIDSGKIGYEEKRRRA
jgi:hypothetical protein